MMSKIIECQVTSCAFNREKNCHAPAITIGGPPACCDTFIDSAEEGGTAIRGSVGACKMTDCLYNDDMECSAGQVKISTQKCDADCVTYRSKG